MSTKEPTKTISRVEIRTALRDIKATGYGRATPVFNRRITAVRQYRNGGWTGQWDPAYVISKNGKKDQPGDSVVMKLAQAVDFLFEQLNGGTAK